jgi:hypothetical protein
MVYIAYLQAGGKENAGSYNKLFTLMLLGFLYWEI